MMEKKEKRETQALCAEDVFKAIESWVKWISSRFFDLTQECMHTWIQRVIEYMIARGRAVKYWNERRLTKKETETQYKL